MSINPILLTLNGQEFVDKNFSELITFNKAILDGSSGILYNLKNDQSYDYTVEIKEGQVFIECQYFKSRLSIQLIPTGFYLRNLQTSDIVKEYINKFCIENQAAFKGILEHLIRTRDNGLPNTRESLAKVIQTVFSNEQTWKERCDIVDRVIDTMIENKTVAEGERKGERTIAFTKNTKLHFEAETYTWSPALRQARFL